MKNKSKIERIMTFDFSNIFTLLNQRKAKKIYKNLGKTKQSKNKINRRR